MTISLSKSHPNIKHTQVEQSIHIAFENVSHSVVSYFRKEHKIIKPLKLPDVKTRFGPDL